ncbi:MAG: hypothetical protein JNJ57_06330, partial [Saprospiraceae bacterium]|nr:hypothetical protein [Saprospiraceae bacterium]
ATSGTQNRYRIDIIELLAVSAQTYSNQTLNDGTIISGEDLAWGRDKDDHCVRAERQAPCSTDPNACHYGVEEFLFEAQKPGAIYPVKEGDYYTYYIVKECFITDFEACWYDTPEERDQVMNNPKDWKFQSVNGSSSQSGSQLCPCGEELPDLPYACMLELKESFLRNWDAIQKDILEDAKRRRDGQYKNLCNPLQEKTGLPRYRLMPVDAGECGPYSFQIVDTCCILAQSPLCFSEASMRDAAMNRLRECVHDEGMHLLEHILLRPQPGDPNCDREQDPSSKNPKCFLPVCPDTDCDNLTWVKDPNSECSSERQENTYIPFSDPYSFWVTITLPAWMGRFQRPEAKALMEYLLRKEAPAHIALNIKWLSPRQLCGFENKFHQWLNTKTCPDLTWSRSHINIDCSVGIPPDESNIKDSAACQLAMCLQDLVRYVPCCEREGQLPQPCACAPRETSKLCPPFELFDKSCCKPEPKKEEPSQPGRSIPDLSTPEKGRAWFNTRLEARSSDSLTKAQVKSLIKTEAGQEAKGRILDNFLRSEGLFAQFKQHIQHLLDTGGTEFSASYKQLAKAAIHHLLDKGLEKTGSNGEPAFEPDAFITAIKPLNEKGLNINEIVNEWPNENLKKVFGKPAVDLYAGMLKKA